MIVYLYFFIRGKGFSELLEFFWRQPMIVYSFSYYYGWKYGNAKWKWKAYNKESPRAASQMSSLLSPETFSILHRFS